MRKLFAITIILPILLPILLCSGKNLYDKRAHEPRLVVTQSLLGSCVPELKPIGCFAHSLIELSTDIQAVETHYRRSIMYSD